MCGKLNPNHTVLVLIGGFVATYLSHPTLIQGASFAAFTTQQINQMVAGKDDPTTVYGSTFARRGDGSWSHAYTSAGLDGVGSRVLEYLDMQSLIFVHSEP